MYDSVLDRPEFFLLGQWWPLAFLLGIEIVDLTLEIPPDLIALVDNRQLFQLINNLIHGFLYGFGKVTIGFLAFHRFQLIDQPHHQRLHFRVIANALLHFLRQSFHFFSGPAHQVISGSGLLLIGVEHLLLENIVGQRGLDLLDSVFGEISLSRLCRPRHHVDVGVAALVVEGGVPAEVTGRDLHGGGDLVAVSTDQVSPLGGVIVSQPLGILTLERNDVCPDVASVFVQLFHGGVHIHAVLVPEEAVRARALRHVLHVAGGQRFYTLAGADVLQITAGAAALDVGALDDQPCH